MPLLAPSSSAAVPGSCVDDFQTQDVADCATTRVKGSGSGALQITLSDFHGINPFVIKRKCTSNVDRTLLLQDLHVLGGSKPIMAIM